MKFKHLFFALFACALFTVSFSSCSDDDDDDTVTSAVVTNLTVQVDDNGGHMITGKITWTKPTASDLIESLIIYTSEDGITRGKKLAEVSVETESYTIEEPIEYVEYFIVVAKLKTGEENTNFTKVPVSESDNIDGIYILNSGNNGNSNANLTFYNYKAGEVVNNIFQNRNGKGLGDTGQDMIAYGSKMYIAVYGSNLIYVTDKHGKEVAVIRPEAEKGRPRNLTTFNGNVYATMYDGYLAKIDTTNYTIVSTLEVGRYPEYVRAANNKLYVANSGGMDYNTELGYDNTVSVIDANTFTKLDDIEVVINPVMMTVDNDENIYVISKGDYNDIPNTPQKIDTRTDEVKTLPFFATEMACDGDKLYYIYSQWGQSSQTYGVFDTKTEEIITENFITDDTVVRSPYSISVDPVKGYVFIGTSDYTTNGDMYIFNTEGKLVNKFDTGGLNPMGAYPVR